MTDRSKYLINQAEELIHTNPELASAYALISIADSLRDLADVHARDGQP